MIKRVQYFFPVILHVLVLLTHSECCLVRAWAEASESSMELVARRGVEMGWWRLLRGF